MTTAPSGGARRPGHAPADDPAGAPASPRAADAAPPLPPRALPRHRLVPRLALFLPTLDDGGAERVMLQLGSSFCARGRAVDLVVGVPGGPLDSQIPPSVRVVELAARRTIRALPALVRYLRRERPLALLSTLEHANVLAVWARGLAGAPTRVVLREASVVLPAAALRGVRPRAQRVLMRRFYPWADALVAVSRSVAESLTGELGVPARLVHTVHNPVVTEDVRRLADAPLDDPWFAPGAPPVVLAVGRLAPEKDHATLLRAFAAVRARRPARLVILGEGPERVALEALARELGVAADVRLPGFDHNPFRFMRRAAVFALSSRFEGLPGALIQAMACGCRVVSTDGPGGARDVLQGGALAPLVPPGDVEALAGAVAAQLEEAARAAARPTYPLERFHEGETVDAYLRVLEPCAST